MSRATAFKNMESCQLIMVVLGKSSFTFQYMPLDINMGKNLDDYKVALIPKCTLHKGDTLPEKSESLSEYI